MHIKMFVLESYQEINVEFVVEEQVKHIHLLPKNCVKVSELEEAIDS